MDHPENVKTSFRNVDEFIEYLSEVRPLLEVIAATGRPEDGAVQNARKALKMFEDDCAPLRTQYDHMKKPDGSVEIGFSADAWAMLRGLR